MHHLRNSVSTCATTYFVGSAQSTTQLRMNGLSLSECLLIKFGEHYCSRSLEAILDGSSASKMISRRASTQIMTEYSTTRRSRFFIRWPTDLNQRLLECCGL